MYFSAADSGSLTVQYKDRDAIAVELRTSKSECECETRVGRLILTTSHFDHSLIWMDRGPGALGRRLREHPSTCVPVSQKENRNMELLMEHQIVVTFTKR